MQSKCTDINSNSNLSTSFLMPVDRYKDLCLRNNENQIQNEELDTFFDHIFDPDRKLLQLGKNDIDTIKNYLTGGIGFDSFKSKCK
jgi:hypothetical protein